MAHNWNGTRLCLKDWLQKCLVTLTWVQYTWDEEVRYSQITVITFAVPHHDGWGSLRRQPSIPISSSIHHCRINGTRMVITPLVTGMLKRSKLLWMRKDRWLLSLQRGSHTILGRWFSGLWDPAAAIVAPESADKLFGATVRGNNAIIICGIMCCSQ